MYRRLRIKWLTWRRSTSCSLLLVLPAVSAVLCIFNWSVTWLTRPSRSVQFNLPDARAPPKLSLAAPLFDNSNNQEHRGNILLQPAPFKYQSSVGPKKDKNIKETNILTRSVRLKVGRNRHPKLNRKGGISKQKLPKSSKRSDKKILNNVPQHALPNQKSGKRKREQGKSIFVGQKKFTRASKLTKDHLQPARKKKKSSNVILEKKGNSRKRKPKLPSHHQGTGRSAKRQRADKKRPVVPRVVSYNGKPVRHKPMQEISVHQILNMKPGIKEEDSVAPKTQQTRSVQGSLLQKLKQHSGGRRTDKVKSKKRMQNMKGTRPKKSQVKRQKLLIKQKRTVKNIFKTSELSNGPPMYNLTILMTGHGIGNIMFMYASMYGIAKINNRQPVIASNSIINEYFQPNAVLTEYWRPGENYTRVKSPWCCKAEQKYSTLPQKNIEINGYFQTWKYFDSVKKDIKKQFTFKKEIRLEAEKFFRENFKPKQGKKRPVLIGVHIRRGDMNINAELKDYGHKIADVDYIIRAMKYFKGKFPDSVFVVCSNDIAWCKRNLREDDIIFSEGRSDIVDLAILAACNHTVMTVGTFGWWAAWLAGGQTVYYKDWPVKGSAFYQSVNRRDYFLPKWIGM